MSIKNQLKIKNRIIKVNLFLLLYGISHPVFASSRAVPWLTYLLLVMFISAVIGFIISWKNPKTESFMGKFLLAGVYFWVLTFAQIGVLGIIYQLTK